MSSTTTLFPLSQFEFIRFDGPDARTFLQGQVTCDVDELTESNLLRGAICNIKGRVIADFELVATESGCLMAVSSGLGEQVTASLGKYAVFSKVEISLAGDALQAFGIIGDNALADLEQNTGLAASVLAEDLAVVATANGALRAIRKPGSTPRVELWCQAPPPFSATQSTKLESLWQEEDMRHGVARITPATTARYTAQDLNYDLSTVVSFTKGCYTGQEIVARMHYRGQAKKRLSLVEISSDSYPEELPDSFLDSTSGKKLDDGIIAWSQDYLQQQRSLVLAILPCVITGSEEAVATLRLANLPSARLSLLALPNNESA